MNLYIYPKDQKAAAKPTWIVVFLYLIGLLHVVGCIIVGALFGGQIIAAWLVQNGLMARDTASVSATIIGIVAGVIVGLFSGLLFFALSQVIDDIHAIRIQTAGYTAVDTDDRRRD